jgi:hypothetical protein
MKHQFDYVTCQIQAANTMPALMASALAGLELVERATKLLATITPGKPHLPYQNAMAEAAKARDALAGAPSLAGPRNPALLSAPAFTRSITELVLVIAEAVLNAACKATEPADRVACLKATQHAGRLYSALR